MKKMNDVINNSYFENSMKTKLTSIFGSGDFSNDVYALIKECADDFVVFDYSTWLYPDETVIDNNNIAVYTSFIHRLIMRKYKYFEFYKNRWSLANGTNYGDSETKERTLNRDRDININNDRTFENTHSSTTNMDYKTDYTLTENAMSTLAEMTETAPLGAEAGIITPNGKLRDSTTADDISTMDRTDGQDITVSTGDNSTDKLVSATTDDYTDTESETITRENGVEILKAIKYNNLSISEVILDIVERTIQEYNEVI